MCEGSLNHNALFLATSAHPSRLYVYQFYWTDETNKAQSSWSYWEFGEGNQVLAAKALDDYVFFVMKRGSKTYLEKMSLAIGANVGLTDSHGYKYNILLDRRVPLSGTYLSLNDYTLFNFPYDVDHASVRIVTLSGSSPGSLVDPSTYTFPTTGVVQVPGNHSGAALGGLVYEFRYRFSEQFMFNRNNVALLNGRLTLRNWTVYFTNTAFFNVEVSSYAGIDPNILSFVPAQESAYTGMTVGDAALKLGSPSFRNGKFTFGVFGASNEATITLTNNTPYPVSFVEAEWEADWQSRNQPL